MKKVLNIIVTLLLVVSCGTSNQMMVNRYSKGYWGEWTNAWGVSNLNHPAFYGSRNNFIVYNATWHPSNYCFKLEILGQSVSETTLINQEIDKWYNYNGYVYFDEDRSWEEFCRDVQNISKHFLDVQKKAVKVKVLRKSNGNYVYNVLSGDNGFAITIPWNLVK